MDIAKVGAGEGNRTLVVSLGSGIFSSLTDITERKFSLFFNNMKKFLMRLITLRSDESFGENVPNLSHVIGALPMRESLRTLGALRTVNTRQN